LDKLLLKELCNLSGVSGREDEVRQWILARIDALATPHEVTVDAMGNVILHLIGRERPSKKLLLDVHIDEVGVIISHITEDGYLQFETVGGIDKQSLFGSRIRFAEHLGVIGGKAKHHCVGEEQDRLPDAQDMLIDIGVFNRASAEDKVQIGQVGTFAVAFEDYEDTGFFVGKAVDNRIGCALLLSLAQTQPPYDIWFSFTVQEEVGLRGAGVVSNVVRPDIAIAIDATTAQDTVGSSDETCVCRVGGGAVVSFADGATLYDSELYATIRQIADENGVRTQTKNRISGGNNAGAIQRSGVGVRMAAVSLPTRYIHSSRCVGKWEDVQAMENLLSLLMERLPR